MRLVGQFWDDEALDAVHGELRYSISENPEIEPFLMNTIAHREREEEQFMSRFIEGAFAEPSLGGAWNLDRRFDFDESYCLQWWDSNGEAIPLFAAYCREGANQEMPLGEAFAPYCILRRVKAQTVLTVDIEIVGNQIRPWLEGVMPLSDVS